MAVVLFPRFELLDVAAPGELLGATPDLFQLFYCAQRPGPVASSCMEVSGGTAGPCFLATHQLLKGGALVSAAGGEPFQPDAILVPGGQGVRTEVDNQELCDWLRDAASASNLVFTVCTGSWLLGAVGALDGVRATSNKAALRAGSPQKVAPLARWQERARWVEDEKQQEAGRATVFITSSGVSAGGDAALAVIARYGGSDRARQVAHRAEWSWQEDPHVDPFADEYGLGA